MELPAQLKSKKVLMGLGLVVLVGVGFFFFQMMSSTEGDQGESRERPGSNSRVAPRRATSTPKKEQTQSPLFQALEALKDPFRDEDPRRAELDEKLSLTQKEIEYLKATLAEKKLKQEIKEIEQALAETDQTPPPPGEIELSSDIREKGETKMGEDILVKAILITDEHRSALILHQGKKVWVHQGELFDGWKVKRINRESVVLSKEGKTFVLFYDRPGILSGGES